MNKIGKILLGLMALMVVLSIVGFIINVAIGLALVAIKVAFAFGVGYIAFLGIHKIVTKSRS